MASRYNYAIWSGLAKNGTQVDVAIDSECMNRGQSLAMATDTAVLRQNTVHTPSTGSDTPLWAYADWAAPGVERLSRLIGADIIKVDPGEVSPTRIASGTSGKVLNSSLTHSARIARDHLRRGRCPRPHPRDRLATGLATRPN